MPRLHGFPKDRESGSAQEFWGWVECGQMWQVVQSWLQGFQFSLSTGKAHRKIALATMHIASVHAASRPYWVFGSARSSRGSECRCEQSRQANDVPMRRRSVIAAPLVAYTLLVASGDAMSIPTILLPILSCIQASAHIAAISHRRMEYSPSIQTRLRVLLSHLSARQSNTHCRQPSIWPGVHTASHLPGWAWSCKPSCRSHQVQSRGSSRCIREVRLPQGLERKVGPQQRQVCRTNSCSLWCVVISSHGQGLQWAAV